MVQNIKNSFNKIFSKLIPNSIKKYKLTKEIIKKFNDYRSKIAYFSDDIYIDLEVRDNAIVNNNIPTFFISCDCRYSTTVFKMFKCDLLQKKFSKRILLYEEFTDEFFDKLLYYTDGRDKRKNKVESILKLFIFDNKIFDSPLRLFVDYGLTTINNKQYTFITYINNDFLSKIFFKDLAYDFIEDKTYSPDWIYFVVRNLPITTVLIDFEDDKLKYFDYDILPKLKTLIKLYKDKIFKN